MPRPVDVAEGRGVGDWAGLLVAAGLGMAGLATPVALGLGVRLAEGVGDRASAAGEACLGFPPNPMIATKTAIATTIAV